MLVAPAACDGPARRELAPGAPALHRAVAAGDLALVRKLLGNNPDLRGPFGWTPLHVAAITNADGSARLLLEHRARVNAQDEVQMTPLHWAARKGHHAIVELLLAHDAEVMALNRFDMTPLHEARTVEVARLLLARGARLDARDVDGMTPLHTATTKPVAQFLIKQGANINARARDGRTPLDMPPIPRPRRGR